MAKEVDQADRLAAHELRGYGIWGGTRRRLRIKHLTNEQRRYFGLLRREWVSASKTALPSSRIDVVQAILEIPDVDLKLEDLVEIEAAVFEIRTGESLRTHAQALLDRITPMAPDVAASLRLQIKAEEAILRQVAISSVRESGRRWMDITIDRRKNYEILRSLSALAIYAAVALVLVIGISPYSTIPPHLVALTLVVILGALGGITRALTKLFAREADGQDSAIVASRFMAILAPTSGIVMALVLYMLAASELLGGQLFPSFTSSGKPSSTLLVIVPSTIADYAKTMVWSFIAGYVGGFVEGFLTSLAAQATKAKEPRSKPRNPET